MFDGAHRTYYWSLQELLSLDLPYALSSIISSSRLLQFNVAQNCCGLQEEAPEKVVVKELDWFGPFPWTRQPGSEKKVHSVSLTLPW